MGNLTRGNLTRKDEPDEGGTWQRGTWGRGSWRGGGGGVTNCWYYKTILLDRRLPLYAWEGVCIICRVKSVRHYMCTYWPLSQCYQVGMTILRRFKDINYEIVLHSINIVAVLLTYIIDEEPLHNLCHCNLLKVIMAQKRRKFLHIASCL